ncbi:MAG: hypothetical protein ACRDM1_07485 [Gaiellaceae bacterium]
MEPVKRLPLGRQLILGAGVLLLIDTFLPWQSISIGPFSHSWTAWHGFWGVLLGLMTIVLVAWVVARAFGVELPSNVPDGLATLALGALILIFAVIKNLADDYSAWGSYLGVILAFVVAAGAWMTFQTSGESLPTVGRSADSA